MTDPHHHDHGGVLLTDQSCPECPIYAPTPGCRFCHGAGVVDLQTLRRWQAEADQLMRD